MTSSQQKAVFNQWFDRSRPFHRTAVLVMKDDEVVGFNAVRADEDKANIGPIGIIPKYRKQGIMKAVFHESLRQLQEDEIKAVYLETDKSNDAAMSLYTKFGFQEQYTQQYFAWRVE